jgi:hypothetical protein
MADTKQKQLVEAIADGAHAKLAPELQALAASIARVAVTCGAIQAQLTMLESFEKVGAPGGAAVKRDVRTRTTASASTGAKKPAKKSGATSTGLACNALLHFRDQMGKNIGNVRESYCTEDNLARALEDPSVVKHKDYKDDKGEYTYYSAIANSLWRAPGVITSEQKAEWKRALELLVAEAKVQEREPQLEEEVAEDE